MVQARNGTAVAVADGSKALSLLLAMIGVIAPVTWAATIKMRTNDNQDENEPVGAGRRGRSPTDDGPECELSGGSA